MINIAARYTNELITKLSNIDLSDSYIDHIAYRIGWGSAGEGDYSKYIEFKKILINFGAEMISEEIVPNSPKGRPISIFKLKDKIKSDLNEIEYFELPAPRIGKVEEEGFTHIEIVINKSLAEFYNENKDFIDIYSNTQEVKLAITSDENNSFGNHEIELDFGTNQKVKFHKMPIWEFLKIQYKETESGIVLENRNLFKNKFPNVLSKL
jgi:predicted metalloenzyme YecM